MIELVVSGRIPSKKNSKRIIRNKKGRPLIISSKAHKDWHQVAVEELSEQHLEQNLNGPVAIKIFAPDRRSGDLTNKAESIMDLLVDLGVIEDDNWFCVPVVILSFGGVDKENPRAEIRVYEPGEEIVIGSVV